MCNLRIRVCVCVCESEDPCVYVCGGDLRIPDPSHDAEGIQNDGEDGRKQ